MTAPITDAASARILCEQVSTQLRTAGIANFRGPPAEPAIARDAARSDSEWEGYFVAVRCWCEDAERLLADRSREEAKDRDDRSHAASLRR